MTGLGSASTILLSLNAIQYFWFKLKVNSFHSVFIALTVDKKVKDILYSD